ncbi:MAG: ABC transporter substrate-binding protein [Candidatus Bipolaricaulia bacterium]
MFDELDEKEKEQIRDELKWAYDFDPKDPLFSLSKSDLRGPKMSRRTVLRLMAAAGTLSLWHLLPGVSSSSAFADHIGGELTAGWAGTGEIRTLDPAQINQVLEFQIASVVLGGLTHINPNLVAEGDLAFDWKVSSDGKEYTFTLLDGVTFHNGDRFTSDDVIFTFNRSKDPEQSIHSRVLAQVEKVEKVRTADDPQGRFHVKFTLSAPQASFLIKTTERASGRALTIVNRRALQQMGTAQYGLTPVGTGPFRVTFHQLGQGVVLEKYDQYYDSRRPRLDKVTIIPIPEPEPLAAAIEAGDIQLIGGNPPAPELIDRFVANRDLVVSQIPGPGFQALWINPWREPFVVTDFNKPVEQLKQERGFKVRLAIAKAIDRETLIERALFGRGVPAFGTINPAMRFFFDTAINETSEQRFDPEAAQQLLAEAGFPNGRGFPTLKLLTTAGGRREGQILVDILNRNLNINVELDIREFPVLIDNFQAMDYDLLRIGSGGDFDPDDGVVDWMQTTSKFNGANRNKEEMPFGFFSEREVDELIDRQRVEPDLNRRKELVQRANQLTSDKVAGAFLFHPLDILVWRKEVNFPNASRIPGLVDLDRVTIAR